MAVFPDRIVLKNSTDSQAAIETAIESGGTDEIAQGEIVIGLETGSARIYTRDASGNIVVTSGTVASIDDLSDVDTSTVPPTDGQFLAWDNAASNWEPADLQGAAVRTALGIGEYVDDAAAGTGGVASGALYYNTTSSDYRLKT